MNILLRLLSGRVLLALLLPLWVLLPGSGSAQTNPNPALPFLKAPPALAHDADARRIRHGYGAAQTYERLRGWDVARVTHGTLFHPAGAGKSNWLCDTHLSYSRALAQARIAAAAPQSQLD